MLPNLNHKSFLKISLDKVLFTIASAYLLLVIFWLFGQGKLRMPWMKVSESNNPEQVSSASDAEFIAYLQQSLAELELKAQQPSTTPQPESIAPPPPPTTTPTETKVIEKIYIPIYPENTSQNLTQPPQIAVNTQPSHNTAPPPPPAAPSEQAFVPPSTVPVLTPGSNLLPNTSPEVVAEPDNVLVGLLEAGEQSSALFKMNGATQRVQLGESIGATGWVLQNIQSQQAVISRQGNVRYLQVGKGF